MEHLVPKALLSGTNGTSIGANGDSLSGANRAILINTLVPLDGAAQFPIAAFNRVCGSFDDPMAPIVRKATMALMMANFCLI